jgi:hypothetical protein
VALAEDQDEDSRCAHGVVGGTVSGAVLDGVCSAHDRGARDLALSWRRGCARALHKVPLQAALGSATQTAHCAAVRQTVVTKLGFRLLIYFVQDSMRKPAMLVCSLIGDWWCVRAGIMA